MKNHVAIVLLALSAAAFGCGPEFDAYNDLEGLRVLFVRADQPELRPGDATHVSALVYHPEHEMPTLRWSLCPWPSDPNGGFRCALDDRSWQRMWHQAGLAGDAPELDLGAADTAGLAFPGTRDQARALCEAVTESLASAPVLPPDCAQRWPWTVRLVAQLGDERVETVKDVTLLIGERLVPNQNPALARLAAGGKTLSPDEVVELELGQDHALRVELAPGAAETYVPMAALGQPQPPPRQESLLFTWFVDHGSTEHVRTTFKQGVEPLDEAVRNEWHAPDRAGEASVYVVVRDPRGGVGFLNGKVRLSE